MKHCKNCEYCRMDLVAQYVKGIDLYKCEKTGEVIHEPFFEKCEDYKKDSFRTGTIGQWFRDWLWQ